MTEAYVIQKPVHWFKSMDWFLYDIGLRHEWVKTPSNIFDDDFDGEKPLTEFAKNA